MLKKLKAALAKIVAAIKSYYTSHLGIALIAAAYIANHNGALARVLHSQAKADTVAGWCELAGVLGCYAGGGAIQHIQNIVNGS